MPLAERFDFLLETHYISVVEFSHNLDFAFNCQLSMLVEHPSSFICFNSKLIICDLMSDKSDVGIRPLTNMSNYLIVVEFGPIFAVGWIC